MSLNVNIAWVAGFFDGEGCVSITRRQRSANFVEHFMAVQIAQKDPRPIRLIHDEFGGCLTIARRGKSSFFYLRFHGKTAERFLKAIEPYVICKDKEVHLGLELRGLIGMPGKRSTKEKWEAKEHIYQRFRELRKKQKDGVALPKRVD